MNDLASNISEAIKQFGRNFIFADFLPAAILVVMNIYMLLPVWSGRADLFTGEIKLELPLVGTTGLAALVGLILISLLVAIVFAGLNSTLIRLLEGKYWWQRSAVLFPLLYLKRKSWQKLYGKLDGLRIQYRQVEETWFREKNEQHRKVIESSLVQLRQEVDKVHRDIEAKHRRQSLPHTKDRVTPTAFGNAYAIIEEYSFERYGIDSVLFWPRLQVLIEKKDANIGERLSYLTGSLDLAINLAFVSFMMLIEIALTLWFLQVPHSIGLFIAAVIALLLCIAFYRASVSAVYSLGEMVMSSFDFYRKLLLDAYELRKPDSLAEEQRLWIKLATFVRRGDHFYFPAEFATASQESDNQIDD